MYKLIDLKKKGAELTQDQIKYFIHGVLNKEIPDYQISAMLMAIYFQGMTTEETAHFTDVMTTSGKTLSFEGEHFVDKHSTGGVGDKASFLLAPIAAACGVNVPMIAGRGLGHTGGTIDKLEAIKGFKTNIGLTKFKKLVNEQGLSIIGQTKEIAPADRIFYALRDVTATIDCFPLITASIMSKKLAEGANGMVFDIKVGNGAFMSNQKNAQTLSKSILATAKRFDKKAVTLLTNMNQPLGRAVGHSIELIECIEILKGKRLKEDLAQLSIELAAYMVLIGGKAKTLTEAKRKCNAVIKNGKALEKFEELIISQGGDPSFIKNYSKLPMASERTIVRATKSGHIKSFDNKEVGFACIEFGGGRKTQGQKIDHGVGFDFHKKGGDKVKEGEPLLTIYHNKQQAKIAQKVSEKFTSQIIKISKTKVEKPKLIYKVIKNF